MPAPVSDSYVTKEDAGYIENVTPSMQRCSTCSMYTNGSCDLVIGMIEPYGVCRYYEATSWAEPNSPNTAEWRLR